MGAALALDADQRVEGCAPPTSTTLTWSRVHDSAEQAYPACRDLQIADPASPVARAGNLWPEGLEHSRPLRVRHRIAAVVAPAKLGHVITGDAAEALDQALQVEACHPRSRDQRCGVAEMPNVVQHRDDAAHGLAEDDRPVDPEGVVERAQIGARNLCPSRQS